MFYDKSLLRDRAKAGVLVPAIARSMPMRRGNDLAVQLGGMSNSKARVGAPCPSLLAYHDHAPPFSVGPDLKPDEDDKQAAKAAADVQNTVQDLAARAARGGMAAPSADIAGDGAAGAASIGMAAPST